MSSAKTTDPLRSDADKPALEARASHSGAARVGEQRRISGGVRAKRLEAGTSTFVERLRSDATSVELGAHELGMLLEGIDVKHVRMARRWSPPFDPRDAQL